MDNNVRGNILILYISLSKYVTFFLLPPKKVNLIKTKLKMEKNYKYSLQRHLEY